MFHSSSSMAESTDKDLMNRVNRRMASISKHLTPTNPLPSSITLSHTSSMDDSYHRTHGQVPTHPVVWEAAIDESGKEFTDIIYEKSVGEGIAKVWFIIHLSYLYSISIYSVTMRFYLRVSLWQITIDRPERRNAFRPQTIKELIRAFNDARDDTSIGVIILTGKVPQI